MTYKIEQFVRKITSPIIVKIGSDELAFENGLQLAESCFDRPLRIADIKAGDDRLVLTLEENERVNDTNWTGEEQAGFF